MALPHFICIGAQKAGTSWLHYQLAQHPEIWVPPVKELHFFDRAHINRYIHLLFSKKAIGKFVRSNFKMMIGGNDTCWRWTFLTQQRTLQNYTNLFCPAVGQIAGETTPGYSRLDEEAIEQVKDLLPKLKIIFLLRDPIDRIWSQVNMFRRSNEGEQNASVQRVFELKEEKVLKNTGYTHTLEKWETHFPKDQWFISFYDRIQEDPGSLMEEVYQFLGVAAPTHLTDQLLKERKNSHQTATLTPQDERWICEHVYDEIVQLHQRFGNNYTQKWLQRAERVKQSS